MMSKQMQRTFLAGLMVLFLAACAPARTMPTSIPAVPPVGSVPGLAPEKYSQYVGMNYPPFPADFSEEISLLMQDANDHSLSLLSNGENKMLWFSRLTHYDSAGNAFWEVRDILDLSDAEAGMMLIPDGCLLNGVPDNEIIVVGKDGKITQAWRANTTLNVFEVIPVSGIECHSDKSVSL